MRKLILMGMFVVLVLSTVACTDTEIGKEQRESSARERVTLFARAEAAVPVRESTNFPLRRALEEFNYRLDQLDHPWYIYILGDTGNMLGYYVGTTRPVNSCNFLSSTEVVQDTGEGSGVVLTAPSLDGIFYGGAGASAGCDAWFFFDVTTGAMIEIRGVKFYVSDQPLLLEAEPIQVGSP